MRFSINKFALVPAVLAAATLMSATAASASPATTVNVPFAFTAAGQAMPAGNYIVEEGSSGNLVYLRNKATSKSISWVTGPGDSAPTDRKVSLKFDEFGSSQVLKAIQIGSQVATFEKKSSKADQETAYVPTRLSQGR